MEERRDQEEYKHVCKLCNKRFPSGKSLGGHMRSHVIANAKANAAAQKLKLKKVPNFERIFNVDDEDDHGGSDLGGGSYGLRENPKKSWRVDDEKSIDNNKQEKICKKCGKGFQSLKALCGHMSCHSNKGRNISRLNSYDDDDSWDIDEEFEIESQSDNNNENNVVDGGGGGAFVVVDSFSLGNGCSSNVSEIEHEQEEVAMCLMMLSRDSSHKVGGVNFATESSDNNSVILEGWSSSTYNKANNQSLRSKVMVDDGTKHVELAKDGMKCVEMNNSDSGYFENGAKELESDDSFGGYARNYDFKKQESPGYGSGFGDRKRHFRSRGKSIDEFEEYGSSKKIMKVGKYECSKCERTFKTHQALGGHIITHKRNNGVYKDHQSEDLISEGGIGIKKAKVHKCPFCPRVFKSGQALGGHKRSHLIGCSSEDRAMLVQSAERQSMNNHHPLLDLNLPAPSEEDAGGGSGGGGGHS